MLHLVDALKLSFQLSGLGFGLAQRISEALQLLNGSLTSLLFLGWPSCSLGYNLEKMQKMINHAQTSMTEVAALWMD